MGANAAVLGIEPRETAVLFGALHFIVGVQFVSQPSAVTRLVEEDDSPFARGLNLSHGLVQLRPFAKIGHLEDVCNHA